MSPLIGSTDFTVNKSAYFVSTISSVLRRRVAVYQRSHWRRCFCSYCQPLHGEFRRAGSCYFTIQTLDLETLRGRHHSYRPTLWDKHLLPGLSDWESLLFVVETHAHLIRCYRLYSTHSTVVASVAQCLQRLSWDRVVVRSNPARASDFFQHFCSVFRRHIRVDLLDDEYLVRNMPSDAFSMLAL